ncbi:sensor domain-containing phosphodiesterase [Halorhodospira halophila]|uniref:Diguanylate phosphodiesterase n=1 Tax=Halorhodospira halophila (strain DSM 244 / SL1) TaxID=349124 RepID=A1WTH4_HALHL|nr:EAL domain-containing protein [Halorhodospira halophila]ABM60986.1 diguanylate phosphodiesterase [Halorhodospira halophila SL1]MBK1730004.1 EAL domain-containing protein [Halorhodospira halophila]
MPRPSDQWFDYRLESAFQPILSLSHRRIVGYEALLRGRCSTTGALLPPARVFEAANTLEHLHQLEQQSQAVHIANFQRCGDPEAPPKWLFLNVSPETVADNAYRDLLPEALRFGGVRQHQIVVELLETPGNETTLAEAVDYFRGLGCLVALDDFGTGYSNFERLWALEPDLVKLDRSLIQGAAEALNSKRRILSNLVALIHEAGSLVVLEGVESEEQAMIALDADIDLVQGFYFALPTLDSHAPAERGLAQVHQVTERFTEETLTAVNREQITLQPYEQTFLRAATRLDRGHGLRESCADLMALRGVQRCFVLNQRGEQVGEHLLPAGLKADAPVTTDPRHAPLVDTRGGTWSRRPYFRDALLAPRRLKISRPYLSSTGRHVCITLSIATRSHDDGHYYVLCCDVAWYPGGAPEKAPCEGTSRAAAPSP